jgi:hypothetical protein
MNRKSIFIVSLAIFYCVISTTILIYKSVSDREISYRLTEVKIGMISLDISNPERLVELSEITGIQPQAFELIADLVDSMRVRSKITRTTVVLDGKQLLALTTFIMDEVGAETPIDLDIIPSFQILLAFNHKGIQGEIKEINEYFSAKVFRRSITIILTLPDLPQIDIVLKRV